MIPDRTTIEGANQIIEYQREGLLGQERKVKALLDLLANIRDALPMIGADPEVAESVRGDIDRTLARVRPGC